MPFDLSKRLSQIKETQNRSHSRSRSRSRPKKPTGRGVTLELQNMPYDVQTKIEKTLRDYYIKSGKRPFPKNLRIKMNPSDINTPELQSLFIRGVIDTTLNIPRGVPKIEDKKSKASKRKKSRKRTRGKKK